MAAQAEPGRSTRLLDGCDHIGWFIQVVGFIGELSAPERRHGRCVMWRVAVNANSAFNGRFDVVGTLAAAGRQVVRGVQDTFASFGMECPGTNSDCSDDSDLYQQGFQNIHGNTRLSYCESAEGAFVMNADVFWSCNADSSVLFRYLKIWIRWL